MWNARVLRVTRERKKRYWRMRGWACSLDAFVSPSEKWEAELGGKGSFSIRAQVRYTSKRRRSMPRRMMERSSCPSWAERRLKRRCLYTYTTQLLVSIRGAKFVSSRIPYTGSCVFQSNLRQKANIPQA